jgi:small GTP-binding protein
MSNQIYKLKMVMIGDAGVGKSCIISRFIFNTYNNCINSTIGAQFMSKEIDNKYKIEIWDTAGQERYRSLIPLYIRGANIICFVISIDTNNVEIEKQKNYWLNYIKTQLGSFTNYTKLLIYNKKDINPNFSYVNDIDFDYSIAVSCKTGEGIPQLNKLINEIVIEISPSNISKNIPNKTTSNTNNETPVDYKQYLLDNLPKKELIMKHCNIL